MKFASKSRGFTLIEVMITVVIIGILSSIAIPYYGDYVRRGKAQEAMAGLADMRVRMEQFFQDNRTYVGFVDANCNRGVAPNLTPAVASKYFTFACVADAVNPTYTITATGVAAQGMNGFSYSINEANAKRSTVPGNAEVGCWITKRGETC